jgi:hypothetical protein
MIATSRFVFLHLHKSGGTFVNECLLRFIPGARQIGYHLPRRLIPGPLSHLPVLGLVRNPWSYYVSWYTFQREQPRPNALFRVLSKGGRLEFEPTIFRMLRLGEDDVLLDELIPALPAAYGSRGLNLPGPVVSEIRGTRRGFYSFLYSYFYSGGTSPLHIGRMENLRWDLLTLLTMTGQEISEELRCHVLEASERNVSRHAAYQQYYSDVLRREVAERDADVIARHQYEFRA